MKKPRQKYYVFLRTREGNLESESVHDTFIGTTWAVSEKQAVNNVRFREEGRTSNSACDRELVGYDSYLYRQYIAELA